MKTERNININDDMEMEIIMQEEIEISQTGTKSLKYYLGHSPVIVPYPWLSDLRQ